MASNLKISTAARNAAVDAVMDLVDGGAAAGTIEVRTGAPPANVGDADSGTLLATLTFSDPAFAAASGGSAAADTITGAVAAASGDAGHFRVKDSNGAVIWQGTAGEAADTPDMTFDEKSFVAGGTVNITAMSFSFPIQ